MNIPLLYEDNHIIAINKPAGLVVHGDGKGDMYTLVDWMIANFPEAKDVGEPITLASGEAILRSGIVHRLDKDTTGVMLLAKTQKGFLHLKEQFKNREVEKTYHAFVYGNLKEDTLFIDEPIGRSSNGVRKWTSGKNMRGVSRDAETVVTVVERGKDKKTGEVVTLVAANPKTGRTHQIRVHLNYVGRPIVADGLYTKRAPLLGFKRAALHAKQISFVALDNYKKTIEAPYPDDFTFALQRFEK